MKIIAIEDAPLLPNGVVYSSNGNTLNRAYIKGDIFIVSDRDARHHDRGEVIIEHHLLGTTMICNRSNFISLEEFREIKLKQLDIF